MSKDMDAVQRLAVSRNLLVNAVRDPVWVILFQRLLKEKNKPPSDVSAKRA
jgi:hypothetical protein